MLPAGQSLRRKRAFNLIEVLLSCTLLLVGLWASFEMVEWGSRAFLLVHFRSGLQAEARRIAAAVGPDLRKSDIHLLSLDDSPARQHFSTGEGESGARQGLAFANLSRWDDSSLIDGAECLPRWDRFTVVYATTEDLGRLVKQHYRPAGSPYRDPIALTGLLSDNPATNPAASSPLILSASVLDFRVSKDDQTSQVRLFLTLAGSAGKKSGRRNLRERCQTAFTWRLENSGAF